MVTPPPCQNADELEVTLRQIRVMRCYATEAGKPISDELAAALAGLAALSQKSNGSTDQAKGKAAGGGAIPKEPEDTARDHPATDQPKDYEAAYRLALEVHRQLAALVHPANPATIASTDFSWNPRQAKPLQRLLIAIALLTVGAMGCFIYASFEINARHAAIATQDLSETPDLGEQDLLAAPPPPNTPPPTDPDAPLDGAGAASDGHAKTPVMTEEGEDGEDRDDVGATANKDNNHQDQSRHREHNRWLSIQLFAAAMLGAGFATLLNAAPYVVQRSFDNSYITFYLIRYLVGIIAGVILGFIGPELIDAFGTESDEGLARLSAAVLAIIGGFSSNAVAAVLTRVSETLLTLVRGRNNESKEDIERRINERVDAEKQRFTATQATKISDILATFDEGPDKAREALRTMIRKPPGV